MIKRVLDNDRIKVHFKDKVTGVSGTVGNFTSTLESGEEIHHGIVILAIGAEPLRPEGMYLYKENPNVLLSLDLDEELAQQSDRLKKAKAVAFIQCVGSRIPERPYCNKVCCAHSVESAIKLKVMNPEMDVFILFRDMRTYGEREVLYTRARELGVVFIRYVIANPPKVEEAGGRLKITVTDQIMQMPVSLEVDLLSLATAIIPHNNAPLAELYKVPLNAEGFFTEAHPKIRPVDCLHRGHLFGGVVPLPQTHPGNRGRIPGLRLPGQHHPVPGLPGAGIHHLQPHR